MHKMLGLFPRFLILSFGFMLISATAIATVVYTYSGKIDRIEYINTNSGSTSPFALGESVYAEISVPGFTTGRFEFYGSMLFIDGVPILGSGTGTGYIQFGSPDERILFIPSASPLPASGNFPETPTDPLIMTAEFCCVFQPPWFIGMENGQAIFIEGDFSALFLPTGQSNINVTAYGSGSWSAHVVSEPATLGMFVLAIISLFTISGRPWCRNRLRGPR